MIDLKERTFTLTISKFTKREAEAVLEYYVSVQPKLQYVVNAQKNVLKAQEGPGENLTFPGMILHSMHGFRQKPKTMKTSR